jgi:hypothetical protein
MKRLWPYLLLNVVISAATMLIVLLIWNATHADSAAADQPGNLTSNSPVFTSVPTATLPPLNAKLFSIQTVVGSGDLENEYVHVVYLGTDQLNLQGWKLLQGNKVVYTFPTFLLYQGGGFDVYTKTGINTSIDLYIGLSSALWQSGDVVRIKDPKGNDRVTYKVP